MKRIVILGGGTGGILAANRLRRSFVRPGTRDHGGGRERQPHLSARAAPRPLRLAPPGDLVRPRRRQLHAGMYACKASVDLFGFTREDFIDQVQDIITVGEFYEKAAGGHIIFT